MKLLGDQVRLSASDLSNHLGCRHLTVLDLAAASGDLEPPSWRDPRLELLQERGLQHEQAYVEHLEAQGLQVLNLQPAEGDVPLDQARAATTDAMRSGAEVIVQATLQNGRWLGRADILRRIDRPSDLGAFSYEVYDTKLSKETKCGAILQLCLYSELVGEIQGEQPERFYVVKTGVGFEPDEYRLEDFLAYHRHLRLRLEAAVTNSNGTYPEPTPQCDICRWYHLCDKRRHDDDHLCLVAGMTKLHQTEIIDHGLETMKLFSSSPPDLLATPERGSAGTYTRLREQARVQIEGREQNRPVHELLPIIEGEGEGLCRLPEPTPGDVFFDFEGARFFGEGGLEYLFGYVIVDGPEPEYKTLWSANEAEEKEAFETFIDEMMARWKEHPGFHIYHFAHYEPTALKRLMGRYATREDELDRLLRGKRLVDLHAVVRQAIRASVESYSLKNLEQFYDFTREENLQDASRALRAIEAALELGRLDALDKSIYDAIEQYNYEDCASTFALREWLERLRAGALADGKIIPRPVHDEDGEPEDALDERLQRVADLKEQLTADVPLEEEERTPEQHARWLLAELLDWHRREKKAFWWEFFRLRDLTYDDLLEERGAIIDLEFVEEVTDGKKTLHRYRYPRQEVGLKRGNTLVDLDEQTIGKIANFKPVARIIDIDKSKKMRSTHPKAVIASDRIPDSPLDTRLLSFAEHVLGLGGDSPGAYRCPLSLLLAVRPRLAGAGDAPNSLKAADEPNLQAAVRLGLELESGILPIQGPPGTGKTFTAAHIIVALIEAGKRVGVTGPSHKVAANLMEKVVEQCKERGVNPSLAHAGKKKLAEEAGVVHAGNNGAAAKKWANAKFDVLSGTAWLWAREDMLDTVDVLFIDEAGQMSLANAIAASASAKNVVLVGDPQQLDQPLKGSHPPGTHVSALEHLLGGEKTMPADRGLFLDTTWRLHPDICSYTSELFYERRLSSKDGLQNQSILGLEDLPENGLVYLPVEHEGNHNTSVEEVGVLESLVEKLTRQGVWWQAEDNTKLPVTLADILIVAPYNAQVVAIEERLPDVRVGTVDKFQGQQAPVVIYSMTTSSPEEAPRGMEFLYNLSRLNVATSRARALSILVANPRLFEPECRSPEQMRMANAFCRYLEMATHSA